MQIIITGDMVINNHYNPKAQVDLNLVNLFKESDYNIVNLEAPITNNKKKILKTGPHLKSLPDTTLEFFRLLNINIACLANNHIKDYDQKGVNDTIEWCNTNSVKSVGAGRDSKDASKPLFLNTSAGKICIINIAENEWASADSNSAGSNGMDLIKDTRCIQKAKVESDFVFVIVHGGHEYYSLPSPGIQERYRFYIDQGADLVVGHHPHAISGYEIYNNSPIYYSLGNFLFTNNSNKEDWYQGLILKINIDNGTLKHSLHPIKQLYNNFDLKLCTSIEKTNVFDQVSYFNSIINDEELLNSEWEKYVDKKYHIYMNHWSLTNFIRSKYFNAVKNKLKINLSNKRSLILYSNLISCESHYELSKKIIKKRIEK